MLRSRDGFTLSEVMVALVLTAVIGAAVTGVFISQVKFYDAQEKASSARGVSRGAVNMLMSELRMLDGTNGVIAANDTLLTARVPYAMGLTCRANGTAMFVSRLPADPVMLASAGHSGFAYRAANGTYTFVDNAPAGAQLTTGILSRCAAENVTIVSGGGIEWRVPTSETPDIGAPIFFYQNITYTFRASTLVPGTRALWRRIEATGVTEELVAPFDTTARFRYYVADAEDATDVPADLTTITGVELTLDGLSERRTATGSATSSPFRTSVFFRNRL